MHKIKLCEYFISKGGLVSFLDIAENSERIMSTQESYREKKSEKRYCRYMFHSTRPRLVEKNIPSFTENIRTIAFINSSLF